MRRKTLTVATALPHHTHLGRLGLLLETAGVKIEREGERVRSIRTPIAMINVDPRLYSRRNWFGINPFAVHSALLEPHFAAIIPGRVFYRARASAAG